MKNCKNIVILGILFCAISSQASEVPPCEKDLTPEKIEPSRYPTSPQKPKEMKGEVFLQFIVEQSGAVSNPTVIESNHVRFSRLALEAVSLYQFPPQFMECTHELKVTFIIE